MKPHTDTLRTVSVLERILLLREIPIFADLSTEDLELVANIAREEGYPQNTVIFHQGEEGNVMYEFWQSMARPLKGYYTNDQMYPLPFYAVFHAGLESVLKFRFGFVSLSFGHDLATDFADSHGFCLLGDKPLCSLCPLW